jgi:hypothetical protein
MKERIFSDEYNESLFAKAVNENFRQTVSEEETYNADFSEKHKERMEKIFAGEGKDSSKYITVEQLRTQNRRKPTAFDRVLRIAAVIAFVFAAGAGYFLSLPNVREAVTESIVAADTKTVTVETADELADTVAFQPARVQTVYTSNGTYYMTFKPVGIEEGNIQSIVITVGGADLDERQVYYIKKDDTFDGVVQGSDDTERRTIITDNARYGVYRSKSGDYPSIITWKHGGAELSISGYYTVSELLDMAETAERTFVESDKE